MADVGMIILRCLVSIRTAFRTMGQNQIRSWRLRRSVYERSKRAVTL